MSGADSGDGPRGLPRRVIGKVLAEYGPFQVREDYLVLPDGTETTHWPTIVFLLPSQSDPAKLEWTPLYPAGRYRRGLVRVLRGIRVFLNGRRELIGKKRADYTMLQGGLEAWQQAGSHEDIPAFEDYPASWVVSTLEALGPDIDRMDRDFRQVEQALLTLEAEHPEIDLGPIEATRDADPELTEELREWSRRKHWWVSSPEPVGSPRAQPKAGSAVARYGRFTVHEWVDGSRSENERRGPCFIISLLTTQGAELVWIPTSAAWVPVTRGSGREETLRAMTRWLQLLREDMLRGRQELENAQDATLIERLTSGLLAREEQFAVIEEALREAEALPE
ncbi:MAG TPA: hypothetical protein VF818_08100 [Ktedonobacterales bacterium]